MAGRQQFHVELLCPAEDVAVVVAEGEIDLYTAPRLQETLDGGLENGARRVIVDLAGVPFIDSSGIDVLVTTYRRLQESGRGLHVVCSRANVLRVFRVSGLSGIFTFHASREEALAALEIDTPTPSGDSAPGA